MQTKVKQDQIKIEQDLELHKVTLGSQCIFGTREELEELCLALEDFCYDEPTYKELEDRTFSLRNEIEELKNKLEQEKSKVRYLPHLSCTGRGIL